MGAPGTVTYEAYLKESAVSREVIDRFLRGPNWAQFDPELGFILSSYMPSDGMDGSTTISTVQANGARTSFMYADRKCRINIDFKGYIVRDLPLTPGSAPLHPGSTWPNLT